MLLLHFARAIAFHVRRFGQSRFDKPIFLRPIFLRRVGAALQTMLRR